MKSIKTIHVEYVIPESDDEKKEIESIIKNFEADKNQRVDFKNMRVKKAHSILDENGIWRTIDE